MDSFTKVADLHFHATHPAWGPVTVLSKWQNSRGHVLHQVSVSTEAGFERKFSVTRYTSLLEGGAR
jgi:hypothetical protein